MLRKRLTKNQELILKALKAEAMKGYVLTVKDIERSTRLSYATVYDNLMYLEKIGKAKRTKIRVPGGWSKRRYWTST